MYSGTSFDRLLKDEKEEGEHNPGVLETLKVWKIQEIIRFLPPFNLISNLNVKLIHPNSILKLQLGSCIPKSFQVRHKNILLLHNYSLSQLP